MLWKEVSKGSDVLSSMSSLEVEYQASVCERMRCEDTTESTVFVLSRKIRPKSLPVTRSDVMCQAMAT